MLIGIQDSTICSFLLIDLCFSSQEVDRSNLEGLYMYLLYEYCTLCYCSNIENCHNLDLIHNNIRFTIEGFIDDVLELLNMNINCPYLLTNSQNRMFSWNIINNLLLKGFITPRFLIIIIFNNMRIWFSGTLVQKFNYNFLIFQFISATEGWFKTLNNFPLCCLCKNSFRHIL